jgi:hypothetical protein
LLPKPPPMSGEITRMLCSSIPEIRETTVRIAWGAWKVPQRVSLPFTLSMLATQPQGSSGQGWVRW